MRPDEAAALVAELCRNLAVLRRCSASDGAARVGDTLLLARYRDVADALGCRAAFEDALLRQTARQRPLPGRPDAAGAG